MGSFRIYVYCQQVSHRLFFTRLLFIAYVRRRRRIVHINIYIGFRKQLLLRKEAFFSSMYTNSEQKTLSRCSSHNWHVGVFFFPPSHWLEEARAWDIFLTGLKLGVAWHICEQLPDTEVFKVMGTIFPRGSGSFKSIKTKQFLHLIS